MKIPPSKPHPELDALIAESRARGPLTPAEIWDQRISFAYGNSMDNPDVTREMVTKRATEMYGPRPSD